MARGSSATYRAILWIKLIIAGIFWAGFGFHSGIALVDGNLLGLFEMVAAGAAWVLVQYYMARLRELRVE